MEKKIKTHVKNELANKIAKQFDKATDKLVDAKVAICILNTEDPELCDYLTQEIEKLISIMCNGWTEYHNKAYGIEVDNEEPF